MEHLPQMDASDVCELMPCQLEWRHVKASVFWSNWVFWSKRQDDELNYQRTISPMMAGVPVVFSSIVAKDSIKSAMEKMWGGDTFVVQFWAPIKVNGLTFLSTADQPFAFGVQLDKRLFEYRKLCLDTLIPIDKCNEDLLGPPGRVFQSGLLECNPDVRSYSAGEFPLLENAIRLGIRSYDASSVFNLHDQQCVGVFEVVSTWPFLYIPHLEMDLESSGLYSICSARDILFKSLQPPEEAVLDQIKIGLDKFRRTHRLPIARIWIPCSQYSSPNVLVCAGCSRDYSGLFDTELGNVSDYCFIMSGKALVGRAFASQGSCFCKDLSMLSLIEYPMVLSARQAKLNQCFAICLRSNCANNFICVVEFFLPPDKMVVRDTKTFLNMLLSTMKEQFPGVRVASGQELGQRMLVEVVKVSSSDELDSFEIGQPLSSVQSLQDGGETTEIDSLCQQSNLQNRENNVATPLLVPSGSSHKHDLLNCEGTVQDDLLLPHPTEEAVTNRGTVNMDVARDDHIEFENDSGQVMQPDSHFEQPSVEIDSTGNARNNDKLEHNDIARCLPVVEAEVINEDSNFIIGATTNNEKIHSQKNNEIQRIEKDYQLTRDTLKQQLGLPLKDAAKNLSVSRATLKRICRVYGISRWPHHKTRKVYHNSSQGISLQGAEPDVGDQQCPDLSPEKGRDCSAHKRSRSTAKPCDDSVISVKVAYIDFIIKFKLTPSSTKVKLEEEVEKRLNISLQRFSIEYQDGDEDWVLIAGDSDLRAAMDEMRSLGRTTMKLQVTQKSRHMKDFP